MGKGRDLMEEYKHMAPIRDSYLERPRTVGELANSQIKMHVKAAGLYKVRLKTVLEDAREGVPSLTQMAANSLVSALRHDSGTGVQVMLNNTPSNLLPLVIRNPRLHYTAWR